jgi:hypothetical protein
MMLLLILSKRCCWGLASFAARWTDNAASFPANLIAAAAACRTAAAASWCYHCCCYCHTTAAAAALLPQPPLIDWQPVHRVTACGAVDGKESPRTGIERKSPRSGSRPAAHYYPAAPCCTLLHPLATTTLLHPAAPCCALLHPAAPCCTLLHPLPTTTLLHPAAPAGHYYLAAPCCALLPLAAPAAH